MTITAPAAAPQRSSSITEHPKIRPIELDEATYNTILAALEHKVELNRHRTALLRAAIDPAVAAALFLDLADCAAMTIDEQGIPNSLSEWMSNHETLSCWVRRYAVRGLTEADDDLAIHATQTRIARLLAGFPAPATEDELTLLHHDPVALVRAAYAITRDLIA